MARRIWKPITIVCRDAETEARLIEAVGTDWKGFATRQMRGRPGGYYEVAWGPDLTQWEVIGGIALSGPDDFIVLPVSGDCREVYLEEVPPQIVRHIVRRLTAIFGKDGSGGSWEEYAWLEENCGVSEEDDNKWLDLLGHYQVDLEEQASWVDLSDEEKRDILAFVTDREKHLPFLLDVAQRYDAVDKRYPADQ